MKSLVVRTDGNSQIGIGHVMRCLALAQAWQEIGGETLFVFSEVTAALESRLNDEGVQVQRISVSSGSLNDAAQTVVVAEAMKSAWVVVDGYHFGVEYQRVIKQAGLNLLFIDDYGHANHYLADLVLNQNIYADDTLYSNCEPSTRLLLGTRYALLRREFWPWRGWIREIQLDAKNILVTLGGVDSDNVTLKVIHALQQAQVDALEVVIVVGDSNPHWEMLCSAIQNWEHIFRLERDVKDMPALMAWADVAISAGGSTCWELAFMGLPAIIPTIADNQKFVGPGLEAHGAAINLGWHGDITPEYIAEAFMRLVGDPVVRSEMAQNGRILVDGFGAARVVKQMKNSGLSIREVQEEDSKLVWEWANDPLVRSVSFSTEPIPWKQHDEWFRKKLADPDFLFYMVLNTEAVPVGQIRFQVEGQEAVVSVGLDADQRGRGYGSKVIWLASQSVFDNTPVSLIHAYIKQENEASVGAFTRAGFLHKGMKEIQGYLAYHFVLKK